MLSVRSILFASLLVFIGCNNGSEFKDDDGAVSPDAMLPAEAGLPDSGTGIWDSTIGPPVTLTLATFNVENFFDEQDDPHHSDDVPTVSQVNDKITKLGAALRQLKADVLALQEVENRPLLEKLNEQELSSLGYDQVRLIEGNDIRGIDVALLSRFPVIEAKSHVNDHFLGVDGDTTTYGFSRDCVEATVEPSPGRKLILLINHLRADNWKEPEESVARRLAQANRVRQIADGILASKPDGNLAVLGDLNDTPDSQTLELIQQGSPPLLDLLTLVPSSERYTFNSSKTQIDYILASPGLEGDLISGSVKANHDAVFEEASDHSPVSAQFTLN
jgi:endonuclease/exonuclease/phosphatase family metal-dependent hydrolase